MLSNLLVLCIGFAGLLLVVIGRVLLEARQTTRRYSLIPWAEGRRPSVRNLMRSRLRNILNLKEGYQAIRVQASVCGAA